jgi:hypothetical protein
MRRLLFIVFILLLRSPQPSNALAGGPPQASQRNFRESAVSDESARFPESEDEIFSTTYERELLSRKIFKKSLPALSRKEIIRWSFKTSRANTFL